MASDEGSMSLAECGDSIDPTTFEQILEMDDDEEEREFSRSIVFGFFEQADETFKKMDVAVRSKNLDELSALGHFLKGSSATLGLSLVRDSCEKIQHLGHGKDETGAKDEKPEYCLSSIQTELKKLRKEYIIVEAALKKFYGES